MADDPDNNAAAVAGIHEPSEADIFAVAAQTVGGPEEPVGSANQIQAHLAVTRRCNTKSQATRCRELDV